MVLSADGTKLYLAQGGNTNNGAPSHFFSNTPEYALSAAVLEIDLVALEAIPNKVFTYAPGVTSTYKYDLPTLDDPTVSNNGAAGNETAGGLDVGGPFGGNDGLNQAILPADAPLRIFATGLRNAYDIVLTQSGKLFTVDNGGNQDLGGVAHPRCQRQADQPVQQWRRRTAPTFSTCWPTAAITAIPIRRAATRPAPSCPMATGPSRRSLPRFPMPRRRCRAACRSRRAS